MNKFEFSDLKETPSNGLGKICRWLVLAVLLVSMDTAQIPFYARLAGKGIAAARESYAQASLQANSAFAAAALEKQELVNERANAQWVAAYTSFTPLK